jgi:malate synthase
MSETSPLDLPAGVEIRAPVLPEYKHILTPEALELVARLHRDLEDRRQALLRARDVRQLALDAGQFPDFLAETSPIRQDPGWRVAPTPPDLTCRWVEITGPTDRKMLINALNSGADVFMADFEDANSPTWANMIEGQINIRDAIERKIEYTSPDGKQYRLNDRVAVLMVRPRGWHLVEKHVWIDGTPVSGGLFDFGLFFYHNARRLLNNGSGPYFYLPKLESHLEARLWNDAFRIAQLATGMPVGVIRATVLIETILAAYEMEEILYELREHSAGLNAGRWDYIFSVIKKFRNQPGFLLPDRGQITMTVPFMRAYTDLLVRTCHKRGAHAMGGMAAFIPSRKDAEINEVALTKVKEDKLRESTDGFDGTWVAHPDLVLTARQIFQQALQGRPHQKGRMREDVAVTAEQLRDFNIPSTQITENGLRQNINVAIQYIESWLRGTGAAAIYNLMEDTATAEISRAQIWQWLHSPTARLSDGRSITSELVHALIPEELEKIKARYGGDSQFSASKFTLAAEIFAQVATQDEFVPFLTLTAYEHLD